ncbi:DUF4190 domain-containing protein [Pseudobutyrivibrio xylanivorans]|uniref:DUF4190 domain-containing protein n=1 Tax=Pseudobutyrivibrio xylanivorans TaxID=185007 RepID=A0A1G5S0T3_PSEXY|nr:DUF4190 domain-containing protein [Pseudobutyrivibrio xylanivorans]SCZ79550.1 hypothetical protein SAMN02910350_01845 [Pseudobutyrivibrio xylanivorans]
MGYDYYYTDDVEREIKNLQNGDAPANYGLAIASLILGAVSLVFFLFLLNIISAIIAIIMGFIFIGSTKAGAKGRGLAIGGIITAVLSIVLCIGSYVVIFQNADNIGKMFENELQNGDSPFYYYEYNGENPDIFRDFDDIEDFYNFDGNSDDFEDFLKEKDDTL